MNEKVLKCLYDIKLAIEEIDSFFVGRQMRFDEYFKDIGRHDRAYRNGRMERGEKQVHEPQEQDVLVPVRDLEKAERRTGKIGGNSFDDLLVAVVRR